MGQVDAGAKGADLSGAIDPRLAIVGVVTVILGTIGIIFTALLVYGGYNYFTSHGEEEKAKKGADIIRMAIIGLIIIMISYSITVFLGSRLPALVTEGSDVAK
jgi:TRAP-type C4-dicarboxylate transport system permease small subunit